MDLSGPFLVLILWVHAMAAVAWIGGSLFYAVALNPAVEQLGRTAERVSLLAATSREFREVVRLAILIFVITGVILAFTRLSQPRITTLYVGVLTVKALLSLWMFWLGGRVGQTEVTGTGAALVQHRAIWWTRPQYVILIVGTAVYLLSIVLRFLYEDTLGPLL